MIHRIFYFWENYTKSINGDYIVLNYFCVIPIVKLFLNAKVVKR